MRALLALLLALLALCAGAQGVLPVPELNARVIDQTDTLDAIQRKGLDEKLAAFEQKKGTQIVVLMVPTTKPEDIASYANRVANAWKVGRKGVGDGIVVIVAKNDRTARIEVAKTLEGAVPDLAASQIIEDAMLPRFRQGDFAGGLQATADQLIARISGEPLPAPAQPSARNARGPAGFDWGTAAIFLFVFAPIVGGILRAVLGSKLGSLATGAGVGFVAMLVSSSLIIAIVAGVIALLFSLLSGFGGGMRRRGWGGPVFFPGSGGGWGGGGGDFGGGGASGRW